MKIYAYNQGSSSAKALAEALGIKRLKHEGKPFHNDKVINWGSSHVERNRHDIIWLNHPDAVANAVNKLTTLKAFKEAGVVCPDWTEDRDEVCRWLDEAFDVVARTILNGHSGQGIEIIKSDGKQVEHNDFDLIDAPLYTKYIKKDQEYRIHVFQGEAFFVQRKARKMDVPNDQVNWKVRNLDGGFIYANKDVEVPELFKQEAVKAIIALGLDFGAVDLITEKKTGNPYILEVNTACGLAGTTLDKYVDQFKKVM